MRWCVLIFILLGISPVVAQQDMTFEKALLTMLENSKLIKSEQYSIDAAYNELRAAKGLRWPKIDIVGSVALMQKDEDIDFGGYLITDKLSGSLEYVFPYTGGSVLSLTMQEGYDSVYKRIPWVECSSQEEFDSLNENNFPVTDGSAIYWYGQSFKYLVPQLEGHIQEVWLEYCTTYDEVLESTNGKYVLNQAIVEKNGLHDETLYVAKPLSFTKGNTGFRVDSDGDTVTNWCLDWFIPANSELKDFFLEDYTPFKQVGDINYIDRLKLNAEPFQYLNIYSQEQANELGINFSIKTEDGRDLTNELMYKFVFWDRTDYIRNGELCPYIYFLLTAD